MNTRSNSTGNYINPLSPVYDLPYDPKGGSGILKAIIWVTFEGHDVPLERLLAYTYSETVNGIEIDIERPSMPYATALEEDIYNAMMEEKKFDHINFISK